MKPELLLPIQVVLGFWATALGAWIFVAPRLRGLPWDRAILPLVFVHTFRFVSLPYLLPGSSDPGVPALVTGAIGWGDLAATVLALVAVTALHRRWPAARALVWLCVAVGLADLICAMGLGLRYPATIAPFAPVPGAPPGWGGLLVYLIGGLYVPALWVSTVMIVQRLVRRTERT